MKQTLLYAAAVSMLSIAACVKSVNSDDLKDNVPLYQSYEVAYDKSGNNYTAMASFAVREASGSRVELNDDASIKLNGNTSWRSATDKTTYHWNGSGNPDMVFTLSKNSGQIITNTVLRTDIPDIDFASVPAIASKNSGFVCSWSGEAVDTVNEWMGINISNGNYTSGKTITANSITITKEDLNNIPAGKITLQLYRGKKMAVKASDGSAGGNMVIRETINREITLSN